MFPLALISLAFAWTVDLSPGRCFPWRVSGTNRTQERPVTFFLPVMARSTSNYWVRFSGWKEVPFLCVALSFR
ncbi:hypothetical protein M758_4G184900 [Ceratodon purpureus]|nr:hypothetical protein M758_4G184900 [Ceratodon purpureus]